MNIFYDKIVGIMIITEFLEKFIVYRFFRKCYRRRCWRNVNKNNNVVLKDIANYKNVFAGKGSYGLIDALFHSKEPNELYIGNFVQLLLIFCL